MLAFSRRSGGIDGRPMRLYMASNVGPSPRSTSSAICLIARSGCAAGTTFSGVLSVSITICVDSVPRIWCQPYPEPVGPVDPPQVAFFNNLLEAARSRGVGDLLIPPSPLSLVAPFM